MRLTSSSLPGPFSVSHSAPVEGSTHSPNEFRCPMEYAGLVAPNGLSDGVLPSGLSRRIFPPRSFGSWARSGSCTSPTAT